MRFSNTFVKLADAYSKHPRYIDSAGGTRSGKTFANLQLLILAAMSDREPTLSSVVSETFPHLKRGAIRDFQAILGSDWNEDAWSKSESIYTFPNGSRIEFFSADQPGKVHGPARDRLFLNEANHIPWETARQLFVRTKGLIIIDYNPTHSFWVHDHVQPRAECVSIHSTYQDNLDNLSQQQVREIEANRGDANWWRVYGEGLVGQLEGLIYDFEQVDALPTLGGRIEAYGMDFGFTNDPTTLLHLYIDNGRREIYVDECCYRPGMLNADIIDKLRAEGIGRATPIFADCAEPKTIEEIHRAGYNCRPCYKGTRKAEQIQRVKGYRMFVTKRSVNTIRELRGYTWAKDKDGRDLNEPIAINDHAMDALRYGVFTYLTDPRHGYHIR